MNCQQCQDVLDHLLVAEPTPAEDAALAEHFATCPDCARQYAQARQALAAITPTGPFAISDGFKERIMAAISDAREFPSSPVTIPTRRFRSWKVVAVLAAAATLLVALLPLFRSGPERGGPQRSSAFSLLGEAYAAEGKLFAGNRIIHLLNEIVVRPVADPTLAKMRWLPLLSLEASGKPRVDQLALPAEAGKGYTVEDRCWYDPATGRFVRVLIRGGRPVFANSYDGKHVCTLETAATAPPRIAKQPVAEDFQAPKSPADVLGIAAGLKGALDTKDTAAAQRSIEPSQVSDAGKVKTDDGAAARVLKLGLPQGGPEGASDAYWLFTVREDDRTIQKMEWFVKGQSLLVIRRAKAGADQGPSMGWDLAGLAKPAAAAAAAPGPSVMFGMVVPNVTVEHMVQKAEFTTYVFRETPAWAGERQITDILDVASPPHRMFLTTYRARDGRHVVLAQAFTYNKMLGSVLKSAKAIYTSPNGIKVWSSSRDEWLAKILLGSARATLKDPPGKELTGYILETPARTFPALAINGKLSDRELHWLIDNLTAAK
jgi:hypothetical protein